MNRRVTSVSLALCLAAIALPAAASADTVKIGSTLGHAANPNGELCSLCVGIQRAQAGGNSPLRLVSPANGVVTQWAVRTGDPGAIYNLRILRPIRRIPPTRVSEPAPTRSSPLTTDSVLINNASLPIKQGDAIGVAAGPAGHDLPSLARQHHR